jgi:hypothetical protein
VANPTNDNDKTIERRLMVGSFRCCENLQAELADKGRSSRVACHRHVIGGDTSQELSSVLIKSFRPFSTVAEINKDKR